MHVLIIAQYFPPDLGGSATRAYNIAKGLVLNDCSVTVVTAFPHYPHGQIPDEYKWKPFQVEYFDKIKVIRTFMLPLESKGLRNRLILFCTFILTSLFAFPLIGNIDVIWAANPDLVAIIPAFIYGKIRNKSVTVNMDDLALEDLQDLKLIERESIFGKFLEVFTKTSYRNVELITPISPGYVEPLLVYGVDKKKTCVVMNGVDINILKS